MRSSTLKGLAFYAAVVMVGCAFSPENKGGGPGNPGNGGAPVIAGIAGAAGNLNVGGTGAQTLDGGTFCGTVNRPLVALPPDVLIVLDRSGSMDNDINDRGCTTDGGMMMGTGQCGANSKWGIMTPAIKQVVSATETTVNWGLKYFADPNNSGCNVNNTAAVNVAPMNATAVNNSITMQTNAAGGISNGSRTPTRAGITGAVSYLNGRTEQNPRFILLATDGLPNCKQGASDTTDDSPAAIQAVQNAFMTSGIPTFVVGIATSGMGTADATLSSMAVAGGYPNPGTPSYYSVDTQQALIDALNAIITKVGGECRFALGPLPSNDGRTSYDAITIFADGVPQDRDGTHADGWDYADASHSSIQLAGSLCQRVMDGQVQAITVAYMCIEP
jgi:hypothetical protein